MWNRPSISGHPTIRDLCWSYPPIVWTVVGLYTMSGEPKRTCATIKPESLRSLALALLGWPGSICVAISGNRKRTTWCQIYKRGIGEGSCSSCSKGDEREKKQHLDGLPQHSKGSPQCDLRNKESFPKAQRCMQTSCMHLRKHVMLTITEWWKRTTVFEERWPILWSCSLSLHRCVQHLCLCPVQHHKL